MRMSACMCERGRNEETGKERKRERDMGRASTATISLQQEALQ